MPIGSGAYLLADKLGLLFAWFVLAVACWVAIIVIGVRQLNPRLKVIHDEAPRMDDRAISVSLAPKLQDPALLVALRMEAPFAVAILFLMTDKPDALPALIVTFVTAAVGVAWSRIPGEAKTATVSPGAS
jgi:hypothetical protein